MARDTYDMLQDASKRLADYVTQVSDALSAQDGAALASLLAVSAPSGAQAGYQDAAAMVADSAKDVSRYVKLLDKQHAALGDMLLQHMRCSQLYKQGRFVEAYLWLERCANAFLQEFRNWESGWAMEALHKIVYELRRLAGMADREMAAQGKVPDKLNGAGSFLMKVFGALAGKGPKRVGALYVTCQLFKVYFKLGTVNLCRSVIRSIETARVFEFEEFPARDRVTYMYYTGRLEVFNDNFVVADQKLMYALTHCKRMDKKNMRLILKYLVPVKLSLGLLPKKLVLSKYQLSEYDDVVRACKYGDIRLLRHALYAYESQFLRSGVYLVLEKLELQVYQRLMKKIYILQKQKEPNKAHQVKMDTIVRALRWRGVDMDIEEVECIVAILIHRNYLKGYFSHKSKVVVLSKVDPFPNVNARHE